MKRARENERQEQQVREALRQYLAAVETALAAADRAKLAREELDQAIGSKKVQEVLSCK